MKKTNTPLYKNPSKPVEARVADLLKRMTLDEKIGQMVQSFGGEYASEKDYTEAIRAGKIGSRIGCDTPWAGNDGPRGINAAQSNAHQKIAVEETRLGIPLINGRDIIHGHRTVSPIPLAQAASFDPDEVREAARTAAREASAECIHWTFAPMMDICRNPKWGRAIECLGEDPYLAEEMAVAMVQGFQGDDLTGPESVAACAKHFAGYGYAEGGRDYECSEITRGTLHNVVLRPFKAAVTRGNVATVMTSFQDNGGTPSTASAFLLDEMLRKAWKFDGFVVSDWGAIQQLEHHGATQDEKDAVCKAIKAGVNMEMINNLYPKYIPELLAEKRITMREIDALVAQILRVKFRCGLFENPYTDADGRAAQIRTKQNLAQVRKQAANCMVLAKNNGILPIAKPKGKTIALVGPMVHERFALGGSWNLGSFDEEFATLGEAFSEAATKLGFNVIIPKSQLWDTQLIDAQRNADIVICCVGEHANATGETHATAHYRLPVGQDQLVDAVRALRKPFVVVCASGRPFPIPAARDFADALLYAWHGGTETARAIADVVFGASEPTGRFPITVPEHEGQIPIYYGRKVPGKIVEFSQNGTMETYPFLDGEPFRPMYPFGYGLGYTTFALESVKLGAKKIKLGDENTVTVKVKNTGKRAGATVVQCYLRDPRASISRPYKELVGFKKVTLKPGTIATVKFAIGEAAMGFYDEDGNRRIEPGEFRIGVGFDSDVALDMSYVAE